MLYDWFQQSNSLVTGRVLLGGRWVGLLAAAAKRFTSLLMELRWFALSLSCALLSPSIGGGSLLQAGSDYTPGNFLKSLVSRVA